MALIDVLRKKQQEITKPAAGPAPASVQGIQQQIATGMTGKAQQQTGPATSSIAQQMAQQEVQTQQKELAQTQQQQAADMAQGIAQQEAEQGFAAKAQEAQKQEALATMSIEEQMANEQLAAKEELADMQLTEQETAFVEKATNQYSNSLKDLASQRGIAENDIFSDLNMQKKSLSADKFQAELEQRAHMLAMSDKRYVAQIQKTGELNNLRDSLAFKKEAMNLQFGESMKVLSQSFDNQRLLNADARQFKLEMAKLSIDDAMKIANAELQASMVSSFIGTGASGASTYAEKGGFDKK